MVIPNPVNLIQYKNIQALAQHMPALQKEYQWQECWHAQDCILIQYQKTLCRIKERKQGGVQIKFIQGNTDIFDRIIHQLREVNL